MADLRAILHEIRDILNSHFETKGEPFNALVEHDQIQTPAVVIEPNGVDWTEGSFNRGHEKWDIALRVLLSTANSKAAGLDKMKYLGGSREVKDVIESATSLRDGSVADDCFVRSAQNFGVWIYNDIAYEGLEISLDVYA